MITNLRMPYTLYKIQKDKDVIMVVFPAQPILACNGTSIQSAGEAVIILLGGGGGGGAPGITSLRQKLWRTPEVSPQFSKRISMGKKNNSEPQNADSE